MEQTGFNGSLDIRGFAIEKRTYRAYKAIRAHLVASIPSLDWTPENVIRWALNEMAEQYLAKR